MARITFEQLVLNAVVTAREISPHDTVQLAAVHGLCLDAAAHAAPHLVPFITSMEGLEALLSQLARLPTLLAAVGLDGAEWTFVRDNPYHSALME